MGTERRISKKRNSCGEGGSSADKEEGAKDIQKNMKLHNK